jgi:fucose permease
MFCGGLFVQAIGVGSNHVAKEVPITLAKEKPRKRHTIAIMLTGPAMEIT